MSKNRFRQVSIGQQRLAWLAEVSRGQQRLAWVRIGKIMVRFYKVKLGLDRLSYMRSKQVKLYEVQIGYATLNKFSKVRICKFSFYVLQFSDCVVEYKKLSLQLFHICDLEMAHQFIFSIFIVMFFLTFSYSILIIKNDCCQFFLKSSLCFTTLYNTLENITE